MLHNKKINKILIANRGEIACRIIKTAKQLGISTVAIYSDVDIHALHVQLADEAFLIGPAPSQDSYLNQRKIIAMAKQAGVDAIHPGYGFLSENAKFVQRCADNAIIFIGPSAEVIALMGDKHRAKQSMQQANIATVPGYQGAQQNIEDLYQQALAIGFPVLIKASAGGGGKGMRLVHAANELKAGLMSAKREALASFDNDELILEKYIVGARHIEAQILADQHGQVLYLYHRDCSIQRRHQKIIEEAPATQIDAITQQRMLQTAVDAVKSIHYQNAGTIEFLLAPNGEFYFMEMNTRLQVEHPITEMICGIDIVAWQIAIAEGKKLTLQQQDIKIHGHAIEARIYAEDPQHNFMPASGKLTYIKFPPPNPQLRIDTGVEQGQEISVYYDPLLAKLVVWAENRAEAIQQLQHNLNATQIFGVTTNLALLYQISQHPDFIQAHVDTEFIQKHQAQLLPEFKPVPQFVLIAASFSLWRQLQLQNQQQAQQDHEINSPWLQADGWRQTKTADIYLALWYQQQHYATYIKLVHDDNYYWHDTDEQIAVQAHWHESQLQLTVAQQSYCFTPLFLQQQIIIFYHAEVFVFNRDYPSTLEQDKVAGAASLIAPMPGIITQICVQLNQTVQAGDPLVIMEAMKMEHTICSPHAGTVTSILFQPGARVNNHDMLIELNSTP